MASKNPEAQVLDSVKFRNRHLLTKMSIEEI